MIIIQIDTILKKSGDLCDAMERYGEQKYHFLKAICKHAGIILENENNKFVCKMNLKNKTIYYM